MTEAECVAWIKTPEFKQLYAELVEMTRRGEMFSLPWAAEYAGLPTTTFMYAIGAELTYMFPNDIDNIGDQSYV